MGGCEVPDLKKMLSRSTLRPLMQPCGHEGDALSNRRYISALTVPDSLPDLANHVGYLWSRADAPTPAMNDSLSGFKRDLEAGSVPVRQ